MRHNSLAHPHPSSPPRLPRSPAQAALQAAEAQLAASPGVAATSGGSSLQSRESPRQQQLPALSLLRESLEGEGARRSAERSEPSRRLPGDAEGAQQQQQVDVQQFADLDGSGAKGRARSLAPAESPA